MGAMEMNSLHRALVIDDDDVARELLATSIRAAGFKTFELPSPIGATQVLVREGIGLLVLDVQMPDMSGDKLARLLRKNTRLKSLAIILVSGCDESELGSLAAGVDADGVVLKSNVRTELALLAKRVMKNRGA
jgi:DNA-binding response OmpR family regulator